MKKFLIAISIIAACALMFLFWGIGAHNSAISSEEQIYESKSAIDIQVNKRNETILMLVQVVEKYDEHEEAIITAVAEARADLLGGDVSGATTVLNAVLEAYPAITSAENYRNLMLEISQCENQIARYQETYNIQVRDYKKKVRSFPNSFFLSVAGYEVVSVDYLDLAGQNHLNFDMNNLFGN